MDLHAKVAQHRPSSRQNGLNVWDPLKNCQGKRGQCFTREIMDMKNARWCGRLFVAEAEGFEPPVPCGTPVFKTGAIDQLCQTSVRVQIYVIRFKMFRIH